MKKNRTMRIAVLMLALSLLTCCFVGSTFAKYTSSATGSSSATVAKWSFSVEGEEIAVEPATTFAFDLFATAGSYDEENDDVAAKKLAPGTLGSFTLDVANNSEVTAAYVITLTETNADNVPLRYSVDNTNWFDSMEALMADSTASGLLKSASIAQGGTANVTVYWQWVFDSTKGTVHAGQTDATDTALGIAAREANDVDTFVPEVTIVASITVTQVD